MIAHFNPLSNWLARFSGRSAVPLIRPNLAQLAQPKAQLPAFVADATLAQRYLALLGPLDWDHFPERDPDAPWPGPQPLPRAPFVAAYLIKLDQQLRYMADLWAFLANQPALIWLVGFPLTPSAAFPWGFDPQASLPHVRLFRQLLRSLPNDCLQFLLDATVQLIRQELPPSLRFGETVVGDTKHILAWVRENNPKVFMKNSDRYDKTRQPKADPDCKLGCKKRSNLVVKTPTSEGMPAKNLSVGQYYWGYASGIIAVKIPDWGEFVLAELTQTFDRPDLSYFFPLMAQTERRLGFKPKFGAFDAGFEAFYVFDYFDQAGGLAAIPLSERGGFKRRFDPNDLPLCQANLGMPLKSTYFCRTATVPHQMGRYVCPLLFPKPTGQTCPINHKRWPKGGCVTAMATAKGARLRYQIDRHSDTYLQLYNQRTASERINALALELGIERPKLRHQQAITNQNTLIYILLNLRALQRVRQLKQQPSA